MKFFECEYRFCQLYRSCPKNHQVEATPHSDVDEAGMPLYFGRCEEISRTFSEVPYERIITDEASALSADASVIELMKTKASHDEKNEILDALKAVEANIVGALKPGQSKIVTAVKKNGKSIDLLRKEFRGENTSPHEMSKANKKVVKKALQIRAKLIKDGTKERNATTDACREVEKLYKIGEYASFEAFRDAVNTIVKNQELAHGLTEHFID